MDDGDMTPNDYLLSKPGVVIFGKSTLSGNHFTIPKENIIHVSCSAKHSAIVCKSGKVVVFGKSNINQFGLKTHNEKILKTTLTSFGSETIRQAACGEDFTLFVSAKGALFACGQNNFGQLGTGDTADLLAPTQISGLQSIKMAAVGTYHSAILANSGEVFVSGHNAEGQLGLGHTKHQNSFTLVPSVGCPIASISCGAYQTAFLATTGLLYTTGLNRHGTLGLRKCFGVCSPKPISLSSAVIAMACGTAHMVALTADGTVWTWGQNYYGQLGIGYALDRSAGPVKCNGLNDHAIIKVFAGGDHTGVITKEGEVLVCGSGDDGEFGPGNEDVEGITLLTKLPELSVKQVAFADSYSLFVVDLTSNEPEKPHELVKQTSTGILDWERSIMSTLECPICFKIMCAPIHQCVNGHNFCNSCRSRTTDCSLCRKPFIGTRNMALESLTGELRLPCPDCLERMTVQLFDKHANICPNRLYSCPINKQCGWNGLPGAILNHTTGSHPHQTWTTLPHLFIHTDFDGLIKVTVLSIHREVFILYCRYNKMSREFHAAAKLVGSTQVSDKYKLDIEFIGGDGDVRMSFCKNVSYDTECVEDILKSDCCIVLNRKKYSILFREKSLICQVAIIQTENYRNRADRINALINRPRLP